MFVYLIFHFIFQVCHNFAHNLCTIFFNVFLSLEKFHSVYRLYVYVLLPGSICICVPLMSLIFANLPQIRLTKIYFENIL